MAAQAVKGPSVRGVRLGAGAGNEVLERLDLLLLCEEDRGLAIMDMSTGYHLLTKRSVGAIESTEGLVFGPVAFAKEGDGEVIMD